VALSIKGELEAAAFQDRPILPPQLQEFVCQGVINSAHALANHV
jgi:hypothetical protein